MIEADDGGLVTAMSFFRELKRRNVIRVGAAYVVASWLLIQVAETIFPLFGLGDTPARIVVVVLAIGLVPVLVFAWLFELTPEGLKKEKDIDRSRPITPHTGKKLDRMIMAVLAIALSYFAFDKFVLDPARDQAREREIARAAKDEARAEAFRGSNGDNFIAVLPFAFLGPDMESEYFADAITDELIGRLGRIGGVQVKSRQSVARFKGTDQDVNEIAGQLGVNLVLEGSVRMVSDRVRVTTQLTDASSGFEEWSDVFDGESNDWFELHEEMAVQIAQALNIHITPSEIGAVRAHYTKDRDAYDAFWRGWLLLESFHSDVSHPRDKLLAAENHLQRALIRDPEYPLALAGLSLANSYYFFYEVEKTAERRERGIQLARRALAINPDLSEGHVALGVAFGANEDHASAIDEFEKALRFDPDNAMIWCLLAFSCIAQEPPDPAAAEEAARISIRNDPAWTYSYQMLGWALTLQGRHREAVDAYQAGAELNPDFYAVQFGLGNAFLELHEYDNALTAFEAARRIDETPEVLVYIAAAHAGLGSIDQALAALELGLESGFSEFDAILGSRYFNPLHGDPRFSAIIDSYKQ